MISFASVTKEFNGHTVLDNVSFTIDPGEFVCVTGPSGAGKSTIIHLLIRAHFATSGVIEVDGANIAELPPSLLQVYRRKTGVLFQDYKLLADRTVEENVAYALEVADETDEDIAQKTLDVLTALGLADRLDSFPHELSGGEMTRVALARALIHKPSILIADEPTGNIDPDQSLQILEILRVANAQGTTVILATHDKTVVDALGVRVLRLENGRLVRDSVGAYTAPAVIAERQAPTPAPVSVPDPVPEPEPEPTPKEEVVDVQPVPPSPADGLPPPGRHVPRSHPHKSSHPAHHSSHHTSHHKTEHHPHHVKPDDIEPAAGSHGKIKPVAI